MPLTFFPFLIRCTYRSPDAQTWPQSYVERQNYDGFVFETVRVKSSHCKICKIKHVKVCKGVLAVL